MLREETDQQRLPAETIGWLRFGRTWPYVQAPADHSGSRSAIPKSEGDSPRPDY